MLDIGMVEPRRYIPLFGLSGLGSNLQGVLFNSPFKHSASLLSSDSNSKSALQLKADMSSTGLVTPTLSTSTAFDSTSEMIDLDNGPSRYAAYAMRLKTVVVTSSRYVAYSSDIGEAFRPLTRPEVVRGAYAISWLYILGDVGFAGYKAAKQYEALSKSSSEPVFRFESEAAQYADSALSSARANLPLEKLLDSKTLASLSQTDKVELRKRHTERVAQATAAKSHHDSVDPSKVSESLHVGLIMARRAVFQSLASMALPAFTIHSIVRYSAPMFAKSKYARIRASGPTVAGLLFVPALPFLFDEPVEHVVDFCFDWVQQRLFGGKEAAHEVVEAAKEKLL